MEENFMATTQNGHELKEKSIRRKKRVFVDMDNVLVDFQSGLDLQSDEIKK